MQFSLYINLSDNNQVDKELTSEVAFTGNIIEESSIVNPVFLIQAQNLSVFNYMYCVDFKRFYYITDIESVRTNLWRVSCAIDVLMTYRESIRNVRAIIASQESYAVGNSFLDDGTFVADNRVSTEVVNFPSGFSTQGVYVLTTIGPGGVRAN